MYYFYHVRWILLSQWRYGRPYLCLKAYYLNIIWEDISTMSVIIGWNVFMVWTVISSLKFISWSPNILSVPQNVYVCETESEVCHCFFFFNGPLIILISQLPFFFKQKALGLFFQLWWDLIKKNCIYLKCTYDDLIYL